jgi:DNA-directed RNA polymerase specialized sigma24 family protein
MTHPAQRWKESGGEVAAPPPRDVGAALEAMSEDDLLRLRALARLRARGLPGGVAWSDLLHEAVLRALEGTRRWPPGVPLLAFLAGIMRSLCDEQWRRRRRESWLPGLEDTMAATLADTAPEIDPERVFAAAEALAAVDRLFASDAVALKVIAGLTNGLGAEEIQRHYGLSAVDYDTARRRMRRALLRHGFARAWP